MNASVSLQRRTATSLPCQGLYKAIAGEIFQESTKTHGVEWMPTVGQSKAQRRLSRSADFEILMLKCFEERHRPSRYWRGSRRISTGSTSAPAFFTLAYIYLLRRDLPLRCPSTLVIFFFNTRGASRSSTTYYSTVLSESRTLTTS